MTNKTDKKANTKANTKLEAQPVGTNALALPWPQDAQGFLGKLKQGGVIAAKRVNGDKERLEKLKTALRIIYEHASARFEQDVENRKVARNNAIAARARVAEKQKNAAIAQAAEMEAAAKRLLKAAGVEDVPADEAGQE